MDNTTPVPILDTQLADTLSEIGDLDQGTLVTLELQKKGVARGPRNNQTIYDDDVVQVLIWTGFSYPALVERGQKKLKALQAKGGFIQGLLQDTHNAGCTAATLAEVCAAIQEVEDHMRGVLAAGASTTGVVEDKTPHWRPLEVAGKKIAGSRVYQGKERPEDPRAPVPGTIYIDGVKLGERVVTPAANGHWTVGSSAKTIAKKILQSRLPSGLYVRYCLDHEMVATVKVGREASEASKAAGIPVDPEAIRSLFKIA